MYQYPDRYDSIALAYVESAGSGKDYWKKSESRALAYARSFLETKERCLLLDIGCGEGRLLAHHSKIFKRVIAIEPDKTRYRIAAMKTEELGLYNVEVANVRLQDSKFEDGIFDAISCSHVIQHIQTRELPEFIQIIQKLLTRRGALILLTSRSKKRRDVFKNTFIKNGVCDSTEVTERQFNQLIAANSDGELPVRLFSDRTLENVLRDQFDIKVHRVFNEILAPAFLAPYMFRDTLINLPVVKMFLGGDALIVSEKR